MSRKRKIHFARNILGKFRYSKYSISVLTIVFCTFKVIQSSPYRHPLEFIDEQGLCWVCDTNGPCRLCDNGLPLPVANPGPFNR